MFQRAIVRAPSANFADGLFRINMGRPNHTRAREQHELYCAALESCGLRLTSLEPDERYPDSTFVEDTAVLTERVAILTLPGAESRVGEADSMKEVLGQFYSELHSIHAPGTVDGGDVCEAGSHFFIGISARTNESGARQLAALLGLFGYTSSWLDIRDLKTILHLKSGLAYLGDNRLAAIEALMDHKEFRGFDLVSVPEGEDYAANCVRVNQHVLVAAGYPAFEQRLQKAGYQTIPLHMSEFEKMDGGLSCLSLRF